MEARPGGALERIWASLLEDPRAGMEHGIDPSDLHRLLIAVSRARAGDVDAARLMRRWADDRYCRPSTTDPRRLSRVEARLWDLLPAEIEGIELSPVTPLATCSAVAPVDQNRVISTTRGTEVVSDPTNVLAIEAALRRKRNPTETVHLAACHRVIRAQPFHGEGLFQHFRLLALVSSARDRGSRLTEADLLTSHLRYWILAVTGVAPDADVIIEFSAFDTPALEERFADTVLAALGPLPPRLTIQRNPGRQRARGYYGSAAIRIDADGNEIGDGGFTDWTARLMADNKERCLISCISTERLATLADPARPAAGS